MIETPEQNLCGMFNRLKIVKFINITDHYILKEFRNQQVPLRISWSACDWLKDVHFIKNSIHEVHQTNTEWREQIKYLAHKMTT